MLNKWFSVFIVVNVLLSVNPAENNATPFVPNVAGRQAAFFLNQTLAPRATSEARAIEGGPHALLSESVSRKIIRTHWRLRRADRKLKAFRKQSQRAATILKQPSLSPKDVKTLSKIHTAMKRLGNAYDLAFGPLTVHLDPLVTHDIQQVADALVFSAVDFKKHPMEALAMRDIGERLSVSASRPASPDVVASLALSPEELSAPDLKARLSARARSPLRLPAGFFRAAAFYLLLGAAFAVWEYKDALFAYFKRPAVVRLAEGTPTPPAEQLLSSTKASSDAPELLSENPLTLTPEERTQSAQALQALTRQEKELTTALQTSQAALKKIQTQADAQRKRQEQKPTPEPPVPPAPKPADNPKFQELTRQMQPGKHTQLNGIRRKFGFLDWTQNWLHGVGFPIAAAGTMPGIRISSIPSAAILGPRVEMFYLRDSFVGFFRMGVFDTYNRGHGQWERPGPNSNEMESFSNLPGAQSSNVLTEKITEEFTEIPVPENFSPLVNSFTFSGTADYDVLLNKKTGEYFLHMQGHLPLQVAYSFTSDARKPWRQTSPTEANQEPMEDASLWESDTRGALERVQGAASTAAVYRTQRNQLVDYVHETAEYTLRADLDGIDHHPADHVPANVDRHKEKVAAADPTLYRLEDCGTSLVLGSALLRQSHHATRATEGYLFGGETTASSWMLHIRGEDYNPHANAWEMFDMTPPDRYPNGQETKMYGELPVRSPVLQIGNKPAPESEPQNNAAFETAHRQIAEQEQTLAQIRAERVRLEMRLRQISPRRTAASRSIAAPQSLEALSIRLSQDVRRIQEQAKTNPAGLVASYTDPRWIEQSRAALHAYNSAIQADYLSAELEIAMESLSQPDAQKLLPVYVRLSDEWVRDPLTQQPQRFFTTGDSAAPQKRQVKHWNVGHSFPYAVAKGVPNSPSHLSVLIPEAGSSLQAVRRLLSPTGRQLGFLAHDEILDMNGMSVMGPALNAASVSSPNGGRDGQGYVIVHPQISGGSAALIDPLTGKQRPLPSLEFPLGDIRELAFPFSASGPGYMIAHEQGTAYEHVVPLTDAPSYHKTRFYRPLDATFVRGPGTLFYYNHHSTFMPLMSVDGRQRFPVPPAIGRGGAPGQGGDADFEVIFGPKQLPLFVSHKYAVGLYDDDGQRLSPPDLEDIQLSLENREASTTISYTGRHKVNGVEHTSYYTTQSPDPVLLDAPGQLIRGSADPNDSLIWKITEQPTGGRQKTYFRIDFEKSPSQKSNSYDSADIEDIVYTGQVYFRHRLPDGRWEMRAFKNIGRTFDSKTKKVLPENIWVDSPISSNDAVTVTALSNVYGTYAFGEAGNDGQWRWRKMTGNPLMQVYDRNIVHIDEAGRIFYQGLEGTINGLFVWDGVQVRRLSNPLENVYVAKYVPGRGLYYLSSESPNNNNFQIKQWTEKGPKILFQSENFIENLSISPTGDIYFAPSPGNDHALHIYRLGQAKPIRDYGDFSVKDFHFSPDGKTINVETSDSDAGPTILSLADGGYSTGFLKGERFLFSPSGIFYGTARGYIIANGKDINSGSPFKSIRSINFNAQGTGVMIGDKVGHDRDRLFDLASLQPLSPETDRVIRVQHASDGTRYYVTRANDNNAPETLIRLADHRPASPFGARNIGNFLSAPNSLMDLYWVDGRLYTPTSTTPLEDQHDQADKIATNPDLTVQTGPVGHSAVLTASIPQNGTIVLMDPSQQLDRRLAWAAAQMLNQTAITRTPEWKTLLADSIKRATEKAFPDSAIPARRRVWLYFLTQGTDLEKSAANDLSALTVLAAQQPEARAALADLVTQTFTLYRQQNGSFAIRPSIDGRHFFSLFSLTDDIETGAVRRWAWRFPNQHNESALVSANRRFEEATNRFPWLRLSAGDVHSVEPSWPALIRRELLGWIQDSLHLLFLLELLLAGVGRYVVWKQLKLRLERNKILNQWVTDFHEQWQAHVYQLESWLNVYPPRFFRRALERHPMAEFLSPFMNQPVSIQAAAYLILIKSGLLDKFIQAIPPSPVLTKKQRIPRSLDGLILKNFWDLWGAGDRSKLFIEAHRYPLGREPITPDRTSFRHFLRDLKKRFNDSQLSLDAGRPSTSLRADA